MNNFEDEVAARIITNGHNTKLKNCAHAFMQESLDAKYSYNFTWLGRPIIQYPQDILAMQEIIWSVKPDLIIETGIAHGGSLVFSAAMLELNAACGGSPDAFVVGVDVDIRLHNRVAIESHPMAKRIFMIQGSSIDPSVIEAVRAKAAGCQRVLVCLDSNHTHNHVLAELEAYAPLVTIGSYCVVFDTVVEDMPESLSSDRPWGPGNNPKSAARNYLDKNSCFEIDTAIQNKILVTVAPGGFLKRIR